MGQLGPAAGVFAVTNVDDLVLLALLIGLRAGWLAWRGRHAEDDAPSVDRVAILSVAGVTAANGGDNVGVYVPVFAAARTGELVAYAAVFLMLVRRGPVSRHAPADRPRARPLGVRRVAGGADRDRLLILCGPSR
ncbi:hypothetical protein [Amycolatopsis sp. NPDC059021]|uniref:hypothetical protein n=1 Tax=Amycolatopsis sp. NPDC059021 TaxID=3346704 RepID=UPI00366D1288